MNAPSPDTERDNRLASIAAQILQRLDAGEPVPDPSKLAALYPDLADDLIVFVEAERLGVAGLSLVRQDQDRSTSKQVPDADLETGDDATGPAVPFTGALPAPPGYEFLAQLGRGGMGVVYRARQIQAGRVVAVKMVLAGTHASEADQARFRVEAEAVARIQHPNVVQVFEVGEHQGQPFFSMEYCPGGSLADRLDGEPLPHRDAADLVLRLARGIHEVHRKEVVHRDLKPANILFAEDGTPKVADFGLARLLDADDGRTRTGAVLGTPSYMAPEQASGAAKSADAAADVYALGAILYECLTGRPPFKGASAADTLVMVRTQLLVPIRSLVPSVPLDLQTVCQTCLEKDAGNRYASASALADDLHRFLKYEPVLVRPRGLIDAVQEAINRPAEAESFFATIPGLIFGIVHHPAVHLLIMGLYLAGAPAAWTFGVMMYHLAAWFVQLWWFQIRRFRDLNRLERKGLGFHFGTWCGVVTLLPLHLTYFGTNVMPLYPVLNAVTATGFFLTGSIFAGRQYVLAAILMSQNLVLPFIPMWMWPLLHALSGFVIFTLFGLHVRRLSQTANRPKPVPVVR